jgi:hypothetical protein
MTFSVAHSAHRIEPEKWVLDARSSNENAGGVFPNLVYMGHANVAAT